MISCDIAPPPQALLAAQKALAGALSRHGIAILPPADVDDTLRLAQLLRVPFSTAMLDPWYNKGVGGVRADYIPHILGILNRAKEVAQHIYLWGFPEIIAPFVERIPQPLTLVAWLTWYFKNNPSVIRGWRSAQMTCLHLAHPGAQLYVEHFLNQAQLEKWAEGKLRYIPGPPSVIEESLLVGFVGRKEQTGHPSQKPVRVIQQLLMMSTREGDLVLDPMSGSGTTAEAARGIGRHAVICDHSEEYTEMAEKRLNVRRVDVADEVRAALAAGAVTSPLPWPGVRRATKYSSPPPFPGPATTKQMALLERYDGGGNGPGRTSKAGRRKPPASS